MEDEERIDELREKIEKMYIERSRVEADIFRQEEKFDIRELSETDIRYRNMVYLRDRYNTLGLEIQKAEEELAELKERPKESQEMSKLQSKEIELSLLEAEAIKDKEELKEFEGKEGQDIGEN